MSSPRFYFALPRLLAMLRGGDSRRAEMNGVEAWAASIAIFIITCFFFAGLLPDNLVWWLCGLALAVLPFLIWLFWLLALYLNSLILNLLRSAGLFRALPQRRSQGVLIATIATAMALGLLQRNSFGAEIGAIWLTAVAMNLVAALVLAFRNGDRVRF